MGNLCSASSVDQSANQVIDQKSNGFGPWGSELSHENGGPNTLYIHPVSGNALACALYIKEKGLEGKVKIHFIDIMKGEQNQEWFLALNPQHTIPTLCTANGKGIWQTGAVLTYLAGIAGEKITDKDRVAIEYRQADAYKYCSGVYGPSLGFFEGDLGKGVDDFIEKVEPMLKHFIGSNKFIGGQAPSIADYAFVPMLSMFEASHYGSKKDQRIAQYMADFKAAVGCWNTVAAMQTGFVASRKGVAPNPGA